MGVGGRQGRCSNSRDTFHNLEVKGQEVELHRLRVLLRASELALLHLSRRFFGLQSDL